MKSETKMEFVETSNVIWDEVTIDTAAAGNFQEIFQLCQLTIERLRKAGCGNTCSP